MDKQFSKLLPDGFSAFENQVAGHNSKDGISPTGILKSDDGCVLKPLTKHPQSETEIGFYENIACKEEYACFRRFVPDYKGTVVLKIQGLDINFLKLQDVSEGYVKPCVMDVKIGARTWDPNASEAKRKTEDDKYNLSKKEFGFCIPGYQVFNLSTNEFQKMGKEEGRTLDRQTLPPALRDFFNQAYGHSGSLISHFLARLDELLMMWLKQTQVHIYSSSLLFTYDAHQLELQGRLKKSQSINAESAKIISTNPSAEPTSWTNVVMIDFAHVVPAYGAVDSNYISGLKNLIKLLQIIKSDQ